MHHNEQSIFRAMLAFSGQRHRREAGSGEFMRGICGGGAATRVVPARTNARIFYSAADSTRRAKHSRHASFGAWRMVYASIECVPDSISLIRPIKVDRQVGWSQWCVRRIVCMIVVNPSLPVRSIRDVIALAGGVESASARQFMPGQKPD